MSDTPQELQIDYGDPALNDPNYEQNVEGNENNGTPQTEQTTDGTAPQPDTQQTGEPAQQQAPVTDGTQTGQGGAGDQSGQPQQQQTQQNTPPGTKPDKDGNLVDANGNIVAAAGAERRTFERVQAQDVHIRDLEKQLEQANARGDLTQALNGAPQQLGLDHNDVQVGLQAIASFKKDPVATARWMLQETMKLGYDLTQIVGQDANGQMNGSQLDLAAVRNMISEAVNPLVQDRNAQQQQTQQQQDAEREYNRFLANHDHASLHESAIVQLMQQRKVSPEVAYWQLKEWAATNGYNFTQPLAPQVQARQQGDNASNGNANPQAQNNQQQPMPNGGAPTADMQSGPTMANADDAWDNIVSQSMQEAGLTR